MADAKTLPAFPQHGAVQGKEFVFATDPGVQGATLWDSYFSAVMTGILAGEHTRGRRKDQMAFPGMLAEYGADIADAMAETRAGRFKEAK
ncbi:MAG TPA: hypothetical protein PLV39_13405 [Fimbriimonadaceae bacterium]|nr:hypothetical protein [Fimbriimonadaceae bacterium]